MPGKLTEWLAKKNPDWQPSYPFPGDVREPVIDALQQAQRGLCVYCGRRLHLDERERYHIEHFRPRSLYPGKALQLANLFLSCGPKAEAGSVSKTCGQAKKDWFEEANCIEPDYPACTRRFRFRLNGDAVPRCADDAKAKRMIEVLKLNHPELKKDREDILVGIDGENFDWFDFVDRENGVASYAHVAGERLGETIP